MSRATVDLVQRDIRTAVGFVKQAREQLASARIAGVGDATLFDRLDRMRRTRHTVFYELAEVSDIELRGAHEDAEAIVEAAARFVLEPSRADR
jgi:hypothetical protein